MIKFQGNIYVSNLPDDFTDEKLAALFDDYGLVLTAFVRRPYGTKRPPIGVLAIAPQDAADQAISALNGRRVGNRQIALAPPSPPRVEQSPIERRRLKARQPPADSVISRGAEMPAPPASGPKRTFTVEVRSRGKLNKVLQRDQGPGRIPR